MTKLVTKSRLVILFLIVCLISACVALLFSDEVSDKTIALAESDSTEFVFKKLNETECDVRLLDKTVTKAIIPSTAIIDGKEYNVTEIAANGFLSASKLKKVRIPQSVRKIGQTAFANCKQLSSITLNAVEEIGANAFAMTSMEYIIIPETVVKVAANILRNTKLRFTLGKRLQRAAASPQDGRLIGMLPIPTKM